MSDTAEDRMGRVVVTILIVFIIVGLIIIYLVFR